MSIAQSEELPGLPGHDPLWFSQQGLSRLSAEAGGPRDTKLHVSHEPSNEVDLCDMIADALFFDCDPGQWRRPNIVVHAWSLVAPPHGLGPPCFGRSIRRPYGKWVRVRYSVTEQ